MSPKREITRPGNMRQSLAWTLKQCVLQHHLSGNKHISLLNAVSKVGGLRNVAANRRSVQNSPLLLYRFFFGCRRALYRIFTLNSVAKVLIHPVNSEPLSQIKKSGTPHIKNTSRSKCLLTKLAVAALSGNKRTNLVKVSTTTKMYLCPEGMDQLNRQLSLTKVYPHISALPFHQQVLTVPLYSVDKFGTLIHIWRRLVSFSASSDVSVIL